MEMEDVITQMATKSFMKELKNPESPIAKKFNSMLYGDKTTGKGGLFEKYMNESMLDNPDKAKTDEQVATEMKNYSRTKGEAALDNTLSGVGTALKAGGNMANLYHGLLGDALIAVSQGLGSQGFDNPFAMATAAGLGKKALGGMTGLGLNAAGDIAQNVGTDIKQNREKNKETELLLRERPSGQFYDARKQLTKNR